MALLTTLFLCFLVRFITELSSVEYFCQIKDSSEEITGRGLKIGTLN